MIGVSPEFAARWPDVAAAIKRGEDKLNREMWVYESGTDADVWTYEMCKHAAFVADDSIERVKRALWWRSEAGKQFRQARAFARAREQAERAGRRYATTND